MRKALMVLFALGAPAFASGCANDQPADVLPEDVLPEIEGPDGQLEFDEGYSATGRFQVWRDASGQLAMSVTGHIALDDKRTVGAAVSPSLVATYRALRPGFEPPARLLELDEEAQRQLERARAELPPSDQAPGEELKSRSSFLATVCTRVFTAGGGWDPFECQYTETAPVITTFSHNYNSGDLSVAWNDNPITVLTCPFIFGTCTGTIFPVPAFTFRFQIWFGASGQDVIVTSAQSPSRKLGVTIHKISVAIIR